VTPVSIHEYAVANTAGGDGNLWFTEWAGNRVGSITTDGAVETHDLPTPAAKHTASPSDPMAACGRPWKRVSRPLRTAATGSR